MAYLEIDNPGKGNCAFYSFSIALIDIIKQETDRYHESITFFNWGERDKHLVIPRKDIIDFNYKNQSTQLLDKLQNSLRILLYEKRKNDLLLAKDRLSASTTFNHFAEMVHAYSRNESCSPNFNELVKSNPVKEYANRIADKIKRLKTLYPESEHLPYHQQRERYSDNLIIEAFNADVYANSPEATLNENSKIINALNDVTINYRWGTNTDLVELAELFNLNLNTFTNGKMSYCPENLPHCPVIRLNNINNSHWTTRLQFIDSDYKQNMYSNCLEDITLTKKEIKAVFLSYTQSSLTFFGLRHHLKKAQDIIEACDDDEFEVTDLIRIIDNYKYNASFNANSSFKKRADYILARIEQFNGADSRLQMASKHNQKLTHS